MSEPFDVKQILIDAVNEEKGLDLPVEALQFDEPTLINSEILDLQDPELRNSRIHVWRDEDDNGPSVDLTIDYNRLDLSKLFAFRSVVFDDPGHNLVSDLLPQINERIGVTLEVEDILDGEIGSEGDVERLVYLEAAPESLGFIGTVELNLIGAESGPVEMDPNVFRWLEGQQWERSSGDPLQVFAHEDGEPYLEWGIGGSFAWLPQVLTAYFSSQPKISMAGNYLWTRITYSPGDYVNNLSELTEDLYLMVVGVSDNGAERFLIASKKLVTTTPAENNQYTYVTHQEPLEIDYSFERDFLNNEDSEGVNNFQLQMFITTNPSDLVPPGWGGVYGYLPWGIVTVKPFGPVGT